MTLLVNYGELIARHAKLLVDTRGRYAKAAGNIVKASIVGWADGPPYGATLPDAWLPTVRPPLHRRRADAETATVRRTMAITFHPRAGCVLMCDFHGYVLPEIVKVRPVVIVSPHHLSRGPLYCVVPLSTTAPHHVEPYHCQLKKDPIPGSNTTVWAKCDMVATVRMERLDRFKVGRGAYKTSAIPEEELEAIRACMKYALGIK